jgi:hypothetical protein
MSGDGLLHWGRPERRRLLNELAEKSALAMAHVLKEFGAGSA